LFNFSVEGEGHKRPLTGNLNLNIPKIQQSTHKPLNK
jgi:hypothetical protein